ncbi:MAG: sensor histidine kinase [Acidimicrobiia bacterium]
MADERERIAKDLHDGAIQALLGVGMGLNAIAAEVPDENIARRLKAAVDALEGAIADIRQYIFSLRPGLLVGRHLSEAVRTLASDTELNSGVVVAVELDVDAMAHLAAREADVLHLVREALSNVARHAHATSCRLRAWSTDRSVVVQIDDDGRGFDVEQARRRGGGVANIEDRARSLGAEVTVSSDHRGTTVTVELPYEGTERPS